MLKLIVLACAELFLLSSAMTYQDAMDLREATWALIDEEADNPSITGETHGYLIGQFVRYAFHHCVGATGCDGCINLNAEDNSGLAVPLDFLRDLYIPFEDIMSRADFLALVGTFAAEKGAHNQYLLRRDTEIDDVDLPTFTYYWGRTDNCNDFEYDLEHVFPHPTWDAKTLKRWFADEFGFPSFKDAVALMGAHSLGKARTKNSKWKGMWVEHGEGNNIDVLDNKFFVDLVDEANELQWVQEELNSGKYRWVYGEPSLVANGDMGLMLPVDMCLWMECADMDEETGQVFDETWLETGGTSVGQKWVALLADKNIKFMKDFSEVFDKMNMRGPWTSANYQTTQLGTLNEDPELDLPNTWSPPPQ